MNGGSAIAIAVVCDDDVVAKQVAQLVRSAKLWPEGTLIRHRARLSDLWDPTDVPAPSLVIAHFSKAIAASALEAIGDDIQKVKANWRQETPVFLSFGAPLTAKDHFNLVVSVGFDMSTDEITQRDLVNAFGLTRLTRNPRTQTRLHRDDASLIRLGKWSIVQADRAVELPDGTRQMLSEAEWNFLLYLVDRDVNNLSLPQHDIAIGQQPRQNALVHKIKRKLGPDFPIVSAGSNRYRLDLHKADGEINLL